MSLEPCPTCGFHRYTHNSRGEALPHTCPPTWLVWSPEDSDEDDARTIYEADPESAAQAWAEWSDNESAEYTIARGTPCVVHVRDARTNEITRWSVCGEYDPTYHAAPMDPEDLDEDAGGAP